jgi:hypothetical protein
MKNLIPVGRGFVVVLACAMLTGCFSYTREVDTPAPLMVQPMLPSSQTTTTTTTDETSVQKQKPTTWGNGGTVQSQTTTTRGMAFRNKPQPTGIMALYRNKR